MEDQYILVEITHIDLRPSDAIKGEIYLNLELLCKEPVVIGDMEIGKLSATISNSPDWSRSFKRAELREALGLEPLLWNINYTKGGPLLYVPVVTEEDLPLLIGKEITVHLIIEEVPLYGKRPRVSHYLHRNLEV